MSFVLSNLLPAKKDDSKKEESGRFPHLVQGQEVEEVEEGTRHMQEPERGGLRGQGRHRTG